MKIKLKYICILLILSTILIFSNGCFQVENSKTTCNDCYYYCFDKYSRGCVSCTCNSCAACLDECGSLCDSFLGEDCTDSCYVNPCIEVGICANEFSCYRNCGSESKMTKNLKDITNLVNVKISADISNIGNRNNYYDIELFFVIDYTKEIEYKDIENLCLVFSIEDVNGNKVENFELFIRGFVSYKTAVASGLKTLTFCYPKENAILINSPDYNFKITKLIVYGNLV